MKKLLFLFLFLFTFPLFPQSNAGDELQQKDFGMLFTLFLDYDKCIGCDYPRFNGQINLINKTFPDSKFFVVYKTNDSSMYDKSIEENLSAKNFIVLTDRAILKKLDVNKMPCLVVYNFHGDEIARFDGMKFDNLQLKEVGKKSIAKKLNYKYVMLDTAENNKLGRPYVFSNFIQDSTYYALDEVKNTIMVYSANTGKLLNKIPPPDTLKKYYSHQFTQKDFELLNKIKMPLASYNTIAPIDNNKFLSISKNVSRLPVDTVEKIAPNGDTSLVISKSIFSDNVLTVFNNFQAEELDTFDITSHNIKYPSKSNNPKYYTSLFPTSGLKINKKTAENVYLAAAADNPLFKNCQLVFPYSKLLDNYNLDTFEINSISSIQYSEKLNTYIYFNPFADKYFFCSYNPDTDDLVKIKPQGFLDICAGSKEHNFYKFIPNDTGYVDNTYITQESIMINDKFYTFILPQNYDGYSNYFIISTYDVNGNFLNETYYYSDDKYYSANFFKNYTDNSGCLLLQSKNCRWHLVKLSDL